MNKLKQLTKRLGVEAGVVAGALVITGGAMMLTGSMLTSAEEKKLQAESSLTQDNTQLATMRSQLERSGEAEKRYIEIQLNRGNQDFSSSTDALRDWMRTAKDRYRLANNLKLNVPPSTKTTKQELATLDYDVLVRQGVTLELEAMSDLHVYAFLKELATGAPGIVRLQYLEMERKGDLNGQTVAQMTGGMAPTLVSAKMKFDWVGIEPKEAAPPAAGTANPPATSGGMP